MQSSINHDFSAPKKGRTAADVAGMSPGGLGFGPWGLNFVLITLLGNA